MGIGMSHTYEYDVFLSFTGADRALKDRIRAYFEAAGLSTYDSDLYCAGQFRPDFLEALDKSRVYLMILTDNLRNNPNETGHGFFTEVRREGNHAADLEAAGQLNIVILTMSEFFRFLTPFHDYRDRIGWHFYSLTRGFSYVAGEVDGEGNLTEQTLSQLTLRCRRFVDGRNAGEPLPSQSTPLELKSESLPDNENFCGRRGESEAVLSAFRAGKRAVALTGLGGMGKSTLAVEIARSSAEAGYFFCPQVIYLRDDESNSNLLGAVAAAAHYEKNVYESLTSLSERDRTERKIAALGTLPETALLLVDNANLATTDAIHQLLQRVPCRVLLTTRAPLKETEVLATVAVSSLPEETAYEMFKAAAGYEPPYEEFLSLYRFTGGHTFTLSLAARLIRAHKMTISELLAEMGGLASFDARVGFRHNEYGDDDTVLGHLTRLFNLSNFDERSLSILRSLSLLGGARIAEAELVGMLSLRNRNELLLLEKTGWLNIEHTVGGEDTLSLHPMASRLVGELLHPTPESCPEMVRYLEEKSDAAKDGMTYTDAALISEQLYGALYTLAGSDGRLAEGLFSRFAETDHLLGNAAVTAQKTAALAARLSEGDGRRVLAYRDMVTVEQFPMRVDLVAPYITAIKENSEDYKWVLRALSVTFSHIQSITARQEDLRLPLEEALYAAIDAAMLRRDDFALCDLFAYALKNKMNHKTLYRLFRPYIAKRGKEAPRDPAYLWLTMLYINICRWGDVEAIGKGSSKYLLNAAHGRFFKNLFSSLLHPRVLFAGMRLYHRVLRMKDDGPIARSLKLIVEQSEFMMTDGQMDAYRLLESAINLHEARLLHHTTLASAAEAVRNTLSLIAALPRSAVRMAASPFLEEVDMENPSVRSLSTLQVLSMVNGALGDRAALEQSRAFLSAVERLRPEGHNDIYDAYLSHARLCGSLGERDEAFKTYTIVYQHLTEVAPQSAFLPEVALAMLNLRCRMSVEQLFTLASVAVGDEKEQSPLHAEVLSSLAPYLGILPVTDREALRERLTGSLRGLAAARIKNPTIGATVLRAIETMMGEEGRGRHSADYLFELIEDFKKNRHPSVRFYAKMTEAYCRALEDKRAPLPLDELGAWAAIAIKKALSAKTWYGDMAFVVARYLYRCLKEEPDRYLSLLKGKHAEEHANYRSHLTWIIANKPTIWEEAWQLPEDTESPTWKAACHRVIAAKYSDLLLKDWYPNLGLDFKALRRLRTPEALYNALFTQLFEKLQEELYAAT